jgi:hypothetical protein
MRPDTQVPVPSDLTGWPSWLERTGIALGLLIVTAWALAKLAGWAKPRAELLIDGALEAARQLPHVLEENRKLNEAVMLALQHQRERDLEIADRLAKLEELLERVNKEL